MSVRNVVVRLRAEINDFKTQMAEAAKASEAVGKRSRESSQQASTALGQFAQSASQHSDAWRTAGTSLLGYGAAVTGITLLIAKQGIEYNTLQQTSRAALTTMLGGARAANAQMDKLDEWARTSPFAKQVFIQAQRQLIGFGYEAKQVLPILDAIQNAVAATGGSNQDIAELTRIFAQVRAAGKITAVDLMQFGQRGVDAATLIGVAMGKTGAQIRSEITAGTLGADEAIAALTAGMQERFGGAAEGVKNTFTGATDRVKAAIRDLSASFTSIIVDPKGGGLGVDALNRLADALRAFESVDPIVRNSALGIGALSGAAALAGGAFLTLAPRIVATKDALTVLAVTMPRAVAALRAAQSILLGPWGLAIAGAAVALGVMANAHGEANRRAEEFTATLDIQTGAVTRASREWVRAELARSGQIEAARDLGVAIETVIDAALGSEPAMRTLRNAHLAARDAAREQVLGAETAATAWQDMSNDQMAAATAALSFAEATGGTGDEMAGLVAVTGRLHDETSLLVAEQQQAAADIEQTGDAAENTAADVDGLAAAAEEAREAFAKWRQEIADSDASFISLSGAYQAVIDKNREVATASAEATESATDSWEDFYDGQTVSIAEYIAELEAQMTAQAEWETNMLTLAGRVSQGVIDELARLGPEGAPLVADLVDASDDELARLETVYAERSNSATHAFATNLRLAGPILAEIMATAGTKAADKAAAALASGETTLQAVIDKYNLGFTIDADTGEAKRSLDRFVMQNNGRTVTVRVVAQPTGPGRSLVGGLMQGNADGGMLTKTREGLVQAYRQGGMFDGTLGAARPQIRPYGGPRGVLWGERGSGPWEAFISGHPGKRDRSLQIWLDVGRRLGAFAAHADGAVRSYAPAMPTRFAFSSPGIDYDRLARAISSPAGAGRPVNVSIPVQTTERADPVAIGAQVAWQVGGLP